MGGILPDSLLLARAPLPVAARCGACGLKNSCGSPVMPVDGEGRKKVLVVGEAPGPDEDRHGRPFVGRTGQFLQDALSRFGVDLRRDCWVTNALRCFPGTSKGKVLNPSDKQVDYCRPFLLQAVGTLKPDVVLLLGSAAVRSLVGWLWKEDPGGVLQWAGWRAPVQRVNAWVCPTFHPSYVTRRLEERDPVTEVIWRRHLEAAFAKKGKPWKVVPDYVRQVETIHDVGEAAGRVREMTKAGAPIAFDFETEGLKPDGGHLDIVSCAVSNGTSTVAYPWHGDVIKATRELLFSEAPKLGWNAKFEERWVLKEFGRGVRNWAFDGMLAAHALDNRKGTKSLKFQAFVQLGQEGYDDAVRPYLQAAEPGGNARNRCRELARESLSTLLLYNAMDALLEWKCCQRLARKLGVEL